jgi:hypothetical protein
MTESPAMSSQKTSESRANTCERINQIKMGLRDRAAGMGSKAMLLSVNSCGAQTEGNFTPVPINAQSISGDAAGMPPNYGGNP